MSDERDDFFQHKRSWSRIKDQILGSYMSPYVAKIANKGYPLLLIDAFAGPGKFEKDNRPGSPLLICQAPEKCAPGRYKAIFVNNNPEYHRQLDEILTAGGWRNAATPILGDSREVLQSLAGKLGNQSVFLYIDPFGLDCEFDVLKPFLERNPKYSTEIVINLSAPILHRLAARVAIENGTISPDQVEAFHSKLTRTLGGDYWKDALLTDNNMDAKDREQLVIDGYRARLASTDYLKYTGACPIQATKESRTKYYMIFASPHPDAMILFNDEMCKAFNYFTHEEETKDTLFAGQSWINWRDTKSLVELVESYVGKFPGKTRGELWFLIVTDHFMRFTSSEYKKAVNQALEKGRISCATPYPSPIRKTKKLNDNCVLMPSSK